MVLHGSIHIRSETYEDNYEARDLLILNPGKSYIISPLEENLVLSLAFEKHFIMKSSEIIIRSSATPGKLSRRTMSPCVILWLPLSPLILTTRRGIS